MANSTITITFNEDFVIGSTIDLIGYWQSASGTTVRRGNSWVNTRSFNGQVTTGVPTSIPGERTAINYVQAFALDYGGGFTIARTGPTTVLITAKDTEWRTVAITAYKSSGVAANITQSYSNTTDTSFNILSTVFSPGAIPCQNISIAVQTTSLATKIISPISLSGNTSNPVSFEWLRGQTINIIVENGSGVQASKTVVLPSLLNSNNFTYQINNSPNGATVVVQNSNMSGLTFQYSLDNVVWQSSSTFSGMASGNHTLYIKDQYGCKVSKTFHINEFGIYTPYFYISKSNSIRFANRITWGDAANYKNDENTLGAEVDVQLAYSGCQNFKSANVITTQFKSNYGSNIVKIIKEDLSEVVVPVVKMTNNIGVKDKRDAIKYNLGNGKTGVYFLSGNIYDYVTNAVLDSFALNGSLPEWAIVGNYIQINTAWFFIEEIFYDEAKEADVVVFTNNYTGIDAAAVVGSIYNDFNYEVYEFTIDMVNYLNQTIQVKIENTDTKFEPITYLSEKIDVAVNFDKNVEIYYWNDDNTDIFYATGIRHLINCELTKQEGVSEEESEAYKTDTTAILLKSQLYELDKFIFEPVSKEIWRKMMIALSHKNVLINGVQYVKNGNFESEGPLDKSNLYQLKATMLKTGIVYNSDSATGDDFNTGSIEVPGLIQTEIGFVKY